MKFSLLSQLHACKRRGYFSSQPVVSVFSSICKQYETLNYHLERAFNYEGNNTKISSLSSVHEPFKKSGRSLGAVWLDGIKYMLTNAFVHKLGVIGLR